MPIIVRQNLHINHANPLPYYIGLPHKKKLLKWLHVEALYRRMQKEKYYQPYKEVFGNKSISALWAAPFPYTYYPTRSESRLPGFVPKTSASYRNRLYIEVSILIWFEAIIILLLLFIQSDVVIRDTSKYFTLMHSFFSRLGMVYIENNICMNRTMVFKEYC